MDSCPSGDYSKSYYDGTCGTAPKTGSGTSSPTPVPTTPSDSKPTTAPVPGVPSKTAATDSSIGAGNLTSILRGKSLKGKTAVLSDETKASLDALAESVASGIIVKTS